MTIHRQQIETPLAAGFAARCLDLLYWSGKQLMIDFGLGGFVEKFEEYFGRIITKIVLGIIVSCTLMLLIAAVAANVIWPLFDIFVNKNETFPTAFQAVSVIATSILWTVLLVLIISVVVNGIQTRSNVLRSSMLVELTERIFSNSKIVTSELQKLASDLTFNEDQKQSLEIIEGAIDDTLDALKERPVVGLEQIIRDSTENRPPRSHQDTAAGTRPKNRPG